MDTSDSEFVRIYQAYEDGDEAQVTALMDHGLADNREDAITMLEDMGYDCTDLRDE